MPWKLSVRAGSRVERARFAQLAEALDVAERRVQELTGDASKSPVDLRYKRFEPVQQVAARIEIAGPERLLPRVRGGIDVRGDGSTEAYIGWIRREVVEQRQGERSIEALRRELHERRSS